MLLGYARVSAKGQDVSGQVFKLKQFGCERIYKETFTGTSMERFELKKMLEFAREGDTIIVTELTRLSRNTKDLFEITEKLAKKSIDIKSLKEAWIDTTTPQGKLMFTIFAGLSQFERDLISQRTREGLEAAKARGRQGGRPSKIAEKSAVVSALYRQGFKISDIVKETNVSRSTVNRILKDIGNNS